MISSQGALTSPSSVMVSSSRTAGAASLELFPGSRSDTSSEMKLSLVTLGMRGLGVSAGWSVEASAKDSGQVGGTRQLAPSVDALSVSDSTSLAAD